MTTTGTERTWYYVTQRGAGSQPVFDTGERRSACVAAIGSSGFEVHGFAVLPWRYHLLLKSTAELLGPGLRSLIQGITRRLRRPGDPPRPVLAARCDWTAVEEREIPPLLAEVHFSPVAARLVTELGRYEWSSYQYYGGTADQPPWLMLGRLQRDSTQPPPPRSTIPPTVSSIPPAYDAARDDRKTPAFGLDLAAIDSAAPAD